MGRLYPIIRRERRPLVAVAPVAECGTRVVAVEKPGEVVATGLSAEGASQEAGVPAVAGAPVSKKCEQR